MGMKTRKVKVRKIKQSVKAPVCSCGSSNLLAFYYRLYGCATDVLVGNFAAVYKWYCVACESEFDIESGHEDIWKDTFAVVHGDDRK